MPADQSAGRSCKNIINATMLVMRLKSTSSISKLAYVKHYVKQLSPFTVQLFTLYRCFPEPDCIVPLKRRKFYRTRKVWRFYSRQHKWTIRPALHCRSCSTGPRSTKRPQSHDVRKRFLNNSFSSLGYTGRSEKIALETGPYGPVSIAIFELRSS